MINEGPALLRVGAKGLYELGFGNTKTGGTLFIPYHSTDSSHSGTIGVKVR